MDPWNLILWFSGYFAGIGTCALLEQFLRTARDMPAPPTDRLSHDDDFDSKKGDHS